VQEREAHLIDLREECELAVVAAAAEERAAHAALFGGITPLHPDWRADEQAEHAARLERWRAASHALVEALDRFASSSERGTRAGSRPGGALS
jgi:uncharacterized protein YukE